MKLSQEQLDRISKLVDPDWLSGGAVHPDVVINGLLDHIEEQWQRISDDCDRMQIISAVVDGGMAWALEARRIARRVEEEEMLRKGREANIGGPGGEK